MKEQLDAFNTGLHDIISDDMLILFGTGRWVKG